MKISFAFSGAAFPLILSFSCACFASNAPIPVVITEVAKHKDLSDSLNYPARVESKVNSLVYAESDGVVTKIYSPLGAKVKKGNRVASVRHTDPIYQYAPMILTAPVDGIVGQVAVTEGSTVNKGALIVSITDPEQLKVVIELAASDLPLFKKDMEGLFQLSGSQEKLPVRIRGLSPFVDPSTGTAQCELTAAQKDAFKLPPGSVGEVFFEVNHRSGFVFPESAVVFRGTDTFVRVVENNIAKKVPVVLGRRERGNIEILKGVKEGDLVIKRTSQFITDGDKVQIEDVKAESKGG